MPLPTLFRQKDTLQTHPISNAAMPLSTSHQTVQPRTVQHRRYMQPCLFTSTASDTLLQGHTNHYASLHSLLTPPWNPGCCDSWPTDSTRDCLICDAMFTLGRHRLHPDTLCQLKAYQGSLEYINHTTPTAASSASITHTSVGCEYCCPQQATMQRYPMDHTWVLLFAINCVSQPNAE